MCLACLAALYFLLLLVKPPLFSAIGLICFDLARLIPQVTPGQRAILDFLQEDLRSGWRLAVRLLAKYSVVGEGEVQGDVVGGRAASPSSPGVVLGGAAAGPGGVSAECVKEAASALSAVMSQGRVPRRDRALALEGLLSEVSGPCVRRLESLRRLQQQQQQQASGAVEAVVGIEKGAPGSTESASSTGGGVAPVSSWPPLDSYSEVMRLLVALLGDGLPSLADTATFQDQTQQERDERLVSCFKAAVEGVAAVAECRRLKMSFLRSKGLSISRDAARPGRAVGDRGGDAGGVGAGAELEGFALLLREALLLVTAGVRSELSPLVHKGSGGAAVRMTLCGGFASFGMEVICNRL